MFASLLAPALMLAAAVQAAAPEGLRDAGRPMPPGTPVALVVLSPGLRDDASQPLVDALEAEGIDAWTLSPPLHAQDPTRLLGVVLPAARAALPGDGHALVGHGLGGTLAARAALDDPPLALALLGAPLRFPRSALTTWMLSLPIPDDGLDLATVPDAPWRGQPALPLLLGQPLPPMTRVSAAWLRGLATWADDDQPLDLRDADFPVWVGVGDLDELAPPEVVRPYLAPDTAFVRFGYLRLDPRPYRSVDLLVDPRPTRTMARALSALLR